MGDAALEAIARRHGVALLLQRGSTVSGPTHAGSDLDIAALFAHAPGLRERMALAAIRPFLAAR